MSGLLGINNFDRLDAKLNTTTCCTSKHIGVGCSLAREVYGCSLITNTVCVLVVVMSASQDDFSNVLGACYGHYVVGINAKFFCFFVVSRLCLVAI